MNLEFQLFKSEKTFRRVLVMAFLVAYWLYQGLWVVYSRFPAVLNSILELNGLLWAFSAWVFPLVAVLGFGLRKYWGLQFLCSWILLQLFGIEIHLAVFGPLLTPISYVWGGLLSFALYFLVGHRDLWSSMLYVLPGKRSVLSLGGRKILLGSGAGLLLAIPWIFSLFVACREGVLAPKLSPAPPPQTVTLDKNAPVLPLGYQLDLPMPGEVILVYPKDGQIAFLVGKTIWELETRNLVFDSVSKMVSTPEGFHRYFRERLGILPKMTKSTLFGEKPAWYFEIDRQGLWGVVSVYRFSDKPNASVRAYLWDDRGKPLGTVESYSASVDPQDWKWIYTLRRSGPSLPTAEDYGREAKRNLKLGRIGPAGLALASAVLVDKDKPARLRELIEFFIKRGLNARARYQLEQGLKDFPQDPILLSIKIPADLKK